MTDACVDVWLDSAGYDDELRNELKNQLATVFNLPISQAEVLTNGQPHRIKRACSTKEAQRLLEQFSSWGIRLRVETAESSIAPSEGMSQTAKGDATFTLAPPGDSIPNLLRNKTPPDVRTDHLHLLDEK